MDKELLAAIKGILQEELSPIRQDIAGLDQKVSVLQTGQHALEAGQQRIEATVNEIRATNHQRHKEIFSRLDAIWGDVRTIERRVERQEEQAAR